MAQSGGVALTLILLTHLSEIVRLLEAIPEGLQFANAVLTSGAESVDRLEIGIGVDLNADDDTVVERVGTLHMLVLQGNATDGNITLYAAKVTSGISRRASRIMLPRV
jgi:hypothetical protein